MEPKTYQSRDADFFGALFEHLDVAVSEFFRDVMSGVRYDEHREIPANSFKAFVKLGVLDLWSDFDDEAKRRLVATDQDGEWLDLERIRRKKSYRKVKKALGESFERAATPRTLSEHVADKRIQDAIAKRTLRFALHGADARASMKALEQINDRAMPVVREPTGPRVVIIQGATREMIERAREELADAGETLELPEESVHVERDADPRDA